MFWLFNDFFSSYPKPEYIWAMVKMRYETEKAILVLHKGARFWIPKSRIGKVKFKKGIFWIYVWKNNLNE